MSTVIKVENLSKYYRLGLIGGRTLSEDVNQWIAKVRGKPNPLLKIDEQNENVDSNGQIWALRDINLEVNEGEILGVIGHNGAGKSTLLKILSRITAPTKGRATIKGRVGSLLEVGTGFHPELTGRENIYLNGAILGMRRKEITLKLDEIIEFAEMNKFIDTPVKRYSSGMHVRLAFAVAAHLEPEILIVDEVLAVGDAAFQKKCLGKMRGVAKEGRTIIFVSHNLAAVENLCNRGILLLNGKLSFTGTQSDAVAMYLRSLRRSTEPLENRDDRTGTGAVRVTSITFKDQDNKVLKAGTSGQKIYIYLHYKKCTKDSLSNVIASVTVKNQSGIPVFLHHNRLTRNKFGPLGNVGAFVLELPKLALPASDYIIGFSIQNNGVLLDGLSEASELFVVEGDFFGSGEVPPVTHGICLVEGKWSMNSHDEYEQTVEDLSNY